MAKKKPMFPVKDFVLPGMTKKKREAIKKAVQKVLRERCLVR